MSPSRRPHQLALGLLIVVVAVLAGTAIAAAPETQIESASRSIPNDSVVHTKSARCPAGYQATGGGAELANPGDDTLTGIYPRRRSWIAGVARNAGLAGPSTLTTYAICLEGVDVTTRRFNATYAGAQEPIGGAFPERCPRGTRAVSGGLRFNPGDGFGAILASYPSGRRGWTLGARQGGAGEFSAYMRCVDGARVVRIVAIGTIDSGETVLLTSRCPAGSRPLGGGVRADGTYDVVAGSFPAGRRAWAGVVKRRVVAPIGLSSFRVFALCGTIPE